MRLRSGCALVFVLCVALVGLGIAASAPAYGQVVSNGGTTVNLTPATATCSAAVRFEAFDPGSVINSKGNAVNVTAPARPMGPAESRGLCARQRNHQSHQRRNDDCRRQNEGGTVSVSVSISVSGSEDPCFTNTSGIMTMTGITSPYRWNSRARKCYSERCDGVVVGG
jgi:hypothetical protein